MFWAGDVSRVIKRGMKALAIMLMGFGIGALYALYLGAIKGEIKWSPEKPLVGAQARLAGIACLVVGLVMITVGGYLANRVLGF